MCGRFVRVPSTSEIMAAYGAVFVGQEIAPSYNIAPSQRTVAIRRGSEGLVGFSPTWGFEAHWTKGSSPLVINARLEGVRERPLFRGLLKEHRCVVPLSGYYEWVSVTQTLESLGNPKKKVPFYVTSRSVDVGAVATLSAAGLWSNDGAQDRVVILTTQAIDSIAFIHDRMPVLLDHESERDWLSMSSEVQLVSLGAMSGAELVAKRVDSQVNDARQNYPELLEPFKGDVQDQLF
jgi:putative SOS response-associated peptidase YedK